MAASSSISNVFTFLLPAKPQAPQFPLSPSLTRFPSPKNNKVGDNLVPLVAHNDHSSSATSSDLSSVMNPSLAHANILFSRSAYNVQVFVDENEPEERLLNRFKREVLRAGVIQECRRRRYFENKQDEKKRRTRDAAKRNRRNRRPPQSRSPMQNKQDVPATKKEEDDDNWDLPEEDLLNF